MSDYTGSTKISEFLASLAGNNGVALSNLFEVDFDYTSAPKLQSEMKLTGFKESGKDSARYKLTLFCEEASLPGIMANTGQTVGVIQGEGQVNYAHTKSYQDISFGWICDGDLLPVKFLNAWMRAIFPDLSGNTTYGGSAAFGVEGKTSINRLNYPDDYQCTITVRKAERNESSTLGRDNGLYTLFNAWPYSIQSTPLSYGSSQLLKVTASFYYRRWKFTGSNEGN
jgi:hypothetical protein